MTDYRRAELARVLKRSRNRLTLAADLTAQERAGAVRVIDALDDMVEILDAAEPRVLGPYAWWVER